MARALPNFIHVGPPRTGTTWLHEVLKRHANLPEPKETRFFDEFYRFGLAWYLQKFSPDTKHSLTGEIYPGYFANPLARQRVLYHIPDCQILCTFREPAARLYSLWRVIRARRLPVDANFETYWRRVLSRGSDLCRYASHLELWQRAFGQRRVLVLFYEDLNSNPQRYLDTVCEFLGIAPIALNDSPVGPSKVHDASRAARLNPISQFAGRAYARLISDAPGILRTLGKNRVITRLLRPLFIQQFDPLEHTQAEEIRTIVLPETERLEELTHRDLSSWKPQSRIQYCESLLLNQTRNESG
jgi:Sulfotransferase domain